jgi:hypothetical protein
MRPLADASALYWLQRTLRVPDEAAAKGSRLWISIVQQMP